MLYRKLLKEVYIFGCIALLLHHLPGYAQQVNTPVDTLRLDLKEAERIFLEKNLSLLAGKYNIEAQKALVQQARLWANPQLSSNQNVYSNNRWFEHGTNPDGTPYGQYSIEIDQLIRTANKRGKLVKMAKTSAVISEWQFNDVLRNLKFQLRKDFYTVLQLQGKQKLYAEAADQLAILLRGMTAQLDAGNIARKDFLRVKAIEVALLQDATQNIGDLNDVQSELKTLLHIAGDVFIQPLPDAGGGAVPVLSMSALLDSARIYNTDYRLQGLQLQYQTQNLSYQKSLAVPDLTVGPNFDKNSDYTPNYFGLTIGFPLPVFDRNQGNIRSARWQVKQEDANLQQIDLKLNNDVRSAYLKLLQLNQLNDRIPQGFYNDYQEQYQKIMKSYQQRQISLIEFIDYFNDYKDTRENQLDHDLNMQMAKEELNFQVGTDVLK